MEESQELEYKDISNSPGVNKSSCDEESVTMNEWPELVVVAVGRSWWGAACWNDIRASYGQKSAVEHFVSKYYKKRILGGLFVSP